MIRNEQEFYNQYDMQVRPSQRRLRRIDRASQKLNSWQYTISDEAMYQYTAVQAIEDVECVEVLMPKDRLESIISYIQYAEHEFDKHAKDQQLMARFERDRLIRLQYPAVEKAYQKYVTLLELCRK
jgi:hypothetical protein